MKTYKYRGISFRTPAILTLLAGLTVAGTNATAASTPKGQPATATPAVSSATAPASEDANVTLSGLLVLGDPKATFATGPLTLRGVMIAVPFLDQPKFKARLETFLGKPLTEAARTEIVNSIIRYYRSHGRPVVDVSLPPQELTGGVLQVLVLEGKLGKIKLEGNRWFNSSYVTSQIRLKQGEDIDASSLGNDLDWLNRNPFRQVDLVYAKGSELGETDVTLRETDSFPLRAYGGYEDSGNQLTGENRLLAGVNWGNVFGIDGQMNYQYMADPAFKWFRAHSGSYVQPLPWRHILTIYGSYADTHGQVAQPFSLGGFNQQVSARYEIPLPTLTSEELNYQHSVVAGFDFKRANNNLAFGGEQVYGQLVDTLQWSLGYDSSLKDPLGDTSLRATLFYSPGHWTDNDTDAAYNSSRAGATARYTYANFEFDRTTGLPWNFILVNRLTFQVSDANLIASEQLGFGGYDTIRGYDTRVVNSDEGYILNNELRTPPIGLLRYAGIANAQDKFQFLGFFDYGMGENRYLLPGEQSQTVLAGIGPGLRYSISTHFSLRADYGWQLHDVEPRQYASRSHIGVVMSF